MKRCTPPDLTVEVILAWVDAYHAARGRWPTVYSGRVGNTNETWNRIDVALRYGYRGLEGNLSLSRLLRRHGRGRRVPARPWTPAEDTLVRELSPREVSDRTGRTIVAIQERRKTLGIVRGRRRRSG